MGIWNNLFGRNKLEERFIHPDSLEEKANELDHRLHPNFAERKPQFGVRSESTWQRIFDRIRHDYEMEGYQDALTTADNKYRDDNISIIQLDLQADIHEAEIAIKEYLKEIEFHINSRRKADLHDLVEELESRREICLDRLKVMEEIKSDVANNTGTSFRIILAYKRGFNKGLAALSMANIINRHV